MMALRQQFPFDLVLMVGDNLYGSQTPADLENKFARPYKPLLDAGVVFRAALGSHDDVLTIHYVGQRGAPTKWTRDRRSAGRLDGSAYQTTGDRRAFR